MKTIKKMNDAAKLVEMMCDIQAINFCAAKARKLMIGHVTPEIFTFSEKVNLTNLF